MLKVLEKITTITNTNSSASNTAPLSTAVPASGPTTSSLPHFGWEPGSIVLNQSVGNPSNRAKRMSLHNLAVNGAGNTAKYKSRGSLQIENLDNSVFDEGNGGLTFPELGVSPSPVKSIMAVETEASGAINQCCWEPSRKNSNMNHRNIKPYLRANLIKYNESKQLTNSNVNSDNFNDRGRPAEETKREAEDEKKEEVPEKVESTALPASLPKSTVVSQSHSNLNKAKRTYSDISFGLVLYDYEADNEFDLELFKNQIVIIVKKSDDGWWEGCHYKPVTTDKFGLFPNNYIQILTKNDPLVSSPCALLSPPPTLSLISKQLSPNPPPRSPKQSQAQEPLSSSVSSTSSSISSVSSVSSSSTNTTTASYSASHHHHPYQLSHNNKTNSANRLVLRSINKSNSSNSLSSLSTSASPRYIKLTPLVPSSSPNQFLLKVHIPPFSEYLMVPFTPKETLRDLLQKLVKNNKLIREALCLFKHPKPTSSATNLALPMGQLVGTISEPSEMGVKLYIPGMDYIEKVNNSLFSVKLFNQFYFNHNPQDLYWLLYDMVSIQVKRAPDGPPIRVIGLNFMDIEVTSHEKPGDSFLLSTLFREEYSFSSDQPTIIKQWVDTLHQSSQYITYRYGPFYQRHHSNSNSSNNSNPLGCSSHTITNSPLSSSDSFLFNSSEFDLIRKQKGNNKCADCASASPEWASLHFGIFLCDTCSEIHQEHLNNADSLGVISALLDDATMWSDYIQLFKKMGNINSNNYWESQTTVNFKKPQPNSSKLEKIQFFKAKYIDKLYI